jgi:hypothetical protein
MSSEHRLDLCADAEKKKENEKKNDLGTFLSEVIHRGKCRLTKLYKSSTTPLESAYFLKTKESQRELSKMYHICFFPFLRENLFNSGFTTHKLSSYFSLMA